MEDLKFSGKYFYQEAGKKEMKVGRPTFYLKKAFTVFYGEVDAIKAKQSFLNELANTPINRRSSKERAERAEKYEKVSIALRQQSYRAKQYERALKKAGVPEYALQEVRKTINKKKKNAK